MKPVASRRAIAMDPIADTLHGTQLENCCWYNYYWSLVTIFNILIHFKQKDERKPGSCQLGDIVSHAHRVRSRIEMGTQQLCFTTCSKSFSTVWKLRDTFSVMKNVQMYCKKKP